MDMLGFSVFLHVSSIDFYTADTAGFSDTMTLFAHNVFRYTILCFSWLHLPSALIGHPYKINKNRLVKRHLHFIVWEPLS